MMTNARLLRWLPAALPSSWQRVDRLEPHVATYRRGDGLTARVRLDGDNLHVDFDRELSVPDATSVLPLFKPPEAIGDTFIRSEGGTSVAIHLRR